MRSLRGRELRRRWREFQALRTDLFDDGGLTVDSPGGLSGDAPPVRARTVIQPDGDTLWMIDDDALGDEELLATHAAAVGRAYGQASATVGVLGVYLTTVQAALSGLVGLASEVGALLRWGWWGLPVGLVVPVACRGLVRWVIGTAMRKGMRAHLS